MPRKPVHPVKKLLHRLEDQAIHDTVTDVVNKHLTLTSENEMIIDEGCAHIDAHWSRNGIALTKTCPACRKVVARDGVAVQPPSHIALANQLDPEELYDLMRELTQNGQ